MIVARSNQGGVHVELWCCVCHRRMALSESWGFFIPDTRAEEIRWVHRPCATDRELRRLFGTKHIVFLRGEEGFRRLLQSMSGLDGIGPDLARQRNGTRRSVVRSYRDVVPGVQRHGTKRCVQ
jgi:hypothetical protein